MSHISQFDADRRKSGNLADPANRPFVLDANRKRELKSMSLRQVRVSKRA